MSKERQIDLHVHTTASDGTFSPSEVVCLAAKAGLSAIAITDHDTVSGYAEAAKAGEQYGIEIIPGIEISTRYQGAVHILGYYVDPNSQGMNEALDWIVQNRDNRNKRICALMQADGLPVYYEKMKARFGDVIGRPHFASVLVELGLAANIQDAFKRYVEKGQKYYLPRTFLPIEHSVEIIAEAGGLPVLAHPFQYRLDDASLRNLIEHCMEYGLVGMECFYTGYTADQSKYLCQLAQEYRLLQTGGSDFHGQNKSHIQLGTGTGSLSVPYTLLEALKRHAGIAER